MTIKRKLFSNTIYLFLDWIGISFFSFLFWVILAKNLSTTEYGYVTTTVNFIIIVSVFSVLGINSALTKLISEFVEKGKRNTGYSYIKFSLKLLSFFLLITSVLLFIFSNNISGFLKLPYNLILLVIPSVIFITLSNFSASILYGFQQMKKYFITDVIGYFIKFFVTLLFFFIGFRYYISPLIGFIFGYFITFVLRFNVNCLKNNNISLSNSKLFYYAFPTYITSITSVLLGYGNYIIISVLKTPEVTGIFAVAFTLAGLIGVIPSILSNALFPIISGLSVNKNTKKRQGYLIAMVLRYSLFLVLPISFIFLIFSKYAVLLFSSLAYISATVYFPILIPAAILVGLSTIFHTTLYATGKPKIQRNTIVLTTIIFISISIPLTKYFSAMGFSIAYFISMALLFILNFIFVRKYMKPKFFVKDIFKVLFSSLLITAIMYYIRPFIQNIFTLILISIPIGLLYLVSLLLTRFYREVDIELLEIFGEKFPFIQKYSKLLSSFIRKNYISND
jgi:O-antigen/teichoic acid export membrane protein